MDVGTGRVVLTDLGATGLLAQALSRTHVSSWSHGQWFGARWASYLDERLVPGEHGLTLLRGDGIVQHYDHPTRGRQSLPKQGSRWPLEHSEAGSYVVTDPATGLERHYFGAVPGGVPLVALRDRTGYRVAVVRDAAGVPLQVRDTRGRTVLVETRLGRVRQLRVVGGDGPQTDSVEQFDFDESGTLTETDTAHGTTRFSYDAGGRLRSWEAPLGDRLRFEYDASGRCTVQRGEDGVLDRDFDYSADPDHEGGTVTVVTDAVGHRRSCRINTRGQVVHEDDALGRSVTTEHDAHDRLLSRTDALGRTTRFVRDDQGRLVRLVRPDGTEQTWQFHEDTELPTRVVQPDGAVWVHEYDDRGNRVSTTDPAGVRTGAAEPESPAAGPIRTYGPFGVAVAETSPEGTTTTFEHDRELRLIRTVHPDGRAETLARDPAGRVREHVDVDGRRTTFEHDAADQVVAERTDRSRTTFQHDLLGRVVRATNEHAELVLVRDAMGRVLSESVDGRAVTSTYDATGRRTRRTTPSGSIATWTHDRDDRVIALVVDGHEITFERDSRGNVVRRHLADAAVLDQVWSSGGQLVGQRLTKVGQAPRAVTSGSLADRLGGGSPAVGAGQPPSGPRLLLERTYDPEDSGSPARTPTEVDPQTARRDPLGRPLAEDVVVWDGDTLAEQVTGSLTTAWTCVDRVPVARSTYDETTGRRELCSVVTDPGGAIIALVAASGDLVTPRDKRVPVP